MTEPTPPSESGLAILGQGMQFFGMLMSIGGSLTILIRGFREPVYYVLLAVGIALWLGGFYLRLRNAKDRDSG